MIGLATLLRLATAALGVAVGSGLLIGAWAGILAGRSPLGWNWVLLQTVIMLGLPGLMTLVAGIRLLERVSASDIKWVLGISITFSCLLIISKMEDAMKLDVLGANGAVGGLIFLAMAGAGVAVYVGLTRWVMLQSVLSQPRVGQLIGPRTSGLISFLLFLTLVSSFAMVEGWLAERIDSVFVGLIQLAWFVVSASICWTLYKRAVARLSEEKSTADQCRS